MKDLTKLIEIKAEKQFKKELAAFINSIRGNQFFKSVEHLEVTLPNGKKETLRLFFWSENHEAAKIIQEEHLPKYIESESFQFMQKVESLQEQIDDLKNDD